MNRMALLYAGVAVPQLQSRRNCFRMRPARIHRPPTSIHSQQLQRIERKQYAQDA